MPLPRRAAALLAASVAALGALLATGAPAGATDDPFWVRQWAPPKIGAPSAWEATTGGGIKVGIVDSGVDLSHQDLQGRIAANAACIATRGVAAACAAGGGQDINGHGTHVSGIVAANKDNGVGTSGIAPGAQVVVARVFQNDSAELADVEAGIRWAVDQGARVVNVSLGENVLLGGLLGGGGGSLVPVLNEAWARGAIPVVAAGNAQLLSGPAGYGNVNAVIVGATGPDDEIAGYSVSPGAAKWAIVAPGGNGADGRQIISTYWQPGGANLYGFLQGTSMATPHVSGSLALLLSRGVGQQRAVELLLATANKGVSCGPTCAGRLDVGAAMAATGFVPAPAPPPTTAPPPSAAPTTAPRPRAAAPSTAPTTAATTVPPAPDTTVATAAPEVTAPPTTAPTEALRTASADPGGDGEDDVAVPGGVAAVLLLGVGAGSLAARRRTG